MKWKVTYQDHIGIKEFHSDEDINFPIFEPCGKTCTEAIQSVKDYLIELYSCNCFDVQEKENALIITEPSTGENIVNYTNFSASCIYVLVDKDGKKYDSNVPGTLGGHCKLKIYGKLDCPSALRYIKKGQYSKYRVFFKDEATAILAGYRPCAICMPKEYQKWKQTLKG